MLPKCTVVRILTSVPAPAVELLFRSGWSDGSRHLASTFTRFLRFPTWDWLCGGAIGPAAPGSCSEGPTVGFSHSRSRSSTPSFSLRICVFYVKCDGIREGTPIPPLLPRNGLWARLPAPCPGSPRACLAPFPAPNHSSLPHRTIPVLQWHCWEKAFALPTASTLCGWRLGPDHSGVGVGHVPGNVAGGPLSQAGRVTSQ